jgi:hypothetical protein
VPDHDVHTEHDPREPVVGHAYVDDDAMADPDAEPLAGDQPVDGNATTYESAAHDPDHRHESVADEAVDESPVGDGRATDLDDRPDGHPLDDARATHEATAGENGFADRRVDDEAFRDRTSHDTAFEHEADPDAADEHTPDGGSAGDEPVAARSTPDEAGADAGELTYTGTPADLPEADDTAERSEADDTAADRSEVGTAADRSGADDSEVVEDTAVDDTDVLDGAAAPAQVPAQSATDEDRALKPGAADGAPVGRLWADADVDGLRARWRDLQLKFIDDPQAVAAEAESLVAEAVDALTAALHARKDALSDWRGDGGTGNEDTERLRAAVRRYRDLFDHLLGL